MLLVAVFVLMAVALALTRGGWREACILGAAGVSGLLVASTEILGAFHLLAKTPLLILWSLVGILTFGFIILRRRGWLELFPRLPCPTPLELTPILAVLFVLGATLLTVAAAPPNNWDVILYHLPRQLQWAQQQSVAHFPTQDYRLTVNPPFAEYVGLHLKILEETDRLNALVSWGSLALTLITVSLLARDLGADRLGQVLAAALAATVPMACHEAASGKNDIVVALWLTAATWWLVRLWYATTITLSQSIFFGLFIGLIALTKGTGTIFALPIVTLAGLRWLHRCGTQAILPLLVVLSIAAMINTPHLMRNQIAYGSLSGQTFGLGNERRDVPAIASNILRNLAMHLALPLDSWNRSVERFIARQHRSLQIDCQDAATTWGRQSFHLEHAPHKEHAAAPWHFAMIVIALLMTSRRLWLLWIVILGGFLVFCLAFKWQPWHPRLHLPLFVLGAAAVGILFSDPRCRSASPLVIAMLLGSALPALLVSEYRPLTGPDSILVHDSERLYFQGRDDILQAARDVVNWSHGNNRLAVINHGALPWEYPLTRLLKKAHNPHVGYFYPVKGSPVSVAPEAVIAIGDEPGPRCIRHESGQKYSVTRVMGPFTLYQPGPAHAEEPLDHAVGRFGIGAEPARRLP